MANFEHIVVAATVYVDGIGKAGTAEKLKTPKIKKKMEKFRGGGMLSERHIGMGYEVTPFEFDLNSFDPQVIAKIGMFSSKFVPLSFRGALDGDKTTGSVIFQCTGEFEEIDPGTWEAGKKSMLMCKGSLSACKLTINGNIVYDMDVTNSVYVFNGVDEFAAIKNALGL